MFHFQPLFRTENGYCCTGEETWCLFVELHTGSLVWLDNYGTFLNISMLSSAVHGDMGYHFQPFTEEACFGLASVCWYSLLKYL